MGTVPTVKTWADGDKPPYTDFANLATATNFLLNPPKVKLRQTSAQSMTTATNHVLTWNAEDVDTDGMHSTVINPTRITPKTPGYYKGWMQMSWAGVSSAADTTGIRQIQIWKNGDWWWPVRIQKQQNVNGQYYQVGQLRFIMPLNGTTDYIEMFVYQTSGVTLNSYVAQAGNQPQFYMRWFAKL